MFSSNYKVRNDKLDWMWLAGNQITKKDNWDWKSQAIETSKWNKEKGRRINKSGSYRSIHKPHTAAPQPTERSMHIDDVTLIAALASHAQEEGYTMEIAPSDWFGHACESRLVGPACHVWHCLSVGEPRLYKKYSWLTQKKSQCSVFLQVSTSYLQFLLELLF